MAVVIAMRVHRLATVFTSTFLINHSELSGLHQVAETLRLARRRRPASGTLFFMVCSASDPSGSFIVFWVTPTISAGILLFGGGDHGGHPRRHHAEERDLVGMFGDESR